jgi:peptidyl-prolyl cis-trans isomerase C
MKSMKLLLIASATSMLVSLSAHAADKDYVILKVGDEKIMRSEVDDVWKGIFPGGNAPAFDTFDQKVKDNLLRGIASEHVLLKEAKKAGVADEADVKARMLASDRQIIIQQFLKEKTQAAVTDDKIKMVYDARQMISKGGEEIRARHILVKTEEEANAIEKKLKKGEKFEKIAKAESQDKGSGAAGGELGWFTPDKMVPEFSKAAFALKKGEVSPPVKTDFGWHVIQVEDVRKTTPPTLDQQKDEIRQEIGNKAVADYVNGAMKGEKIEVLDADGKSRELPINVPDGTPDVAK